MNMTTVILFLGYLCCFILGRWSRGSQILKTIEQEADRAYQNDVPDRCNYQERKLWAGNVAGLRAAAMLMIDVLLVVLVIVILVWLIRMFLPR
jgi:hypothetical protein